jgi:glycosyltransferase involved in cell wall biosynthesis
MLISVVTSTYNRSNVLRYAIESVIWQTLTDWELIVVGDACTDDTADVVTSFNDPRIRFINRSENFGEQSAPNNDGIALAHGEYVAFLNHDDIWLPDHLAIAIERIRAGGADLVFSEGLLMGANGVASVNGSTSTGRYEPWVFAPASGWLFRRELGARVGPWAAARDRYTVPSQEWIYRAWRSGASITAITKVTWLAIVSGYRRGSYSERQEAEHARWMQRLHDDPNVIANVIEEIAIRTAAENTGSRITIHLKRAAKALFRRLCLIAGVHPHAPRNALMFGRRGRAVDLARKVRGLPPLPRAGRGTS